MTTKDKEESTGGVGRQHPDPREALRQWRRRMREPPEDAEQHQHQDREANRAMQQQYQLAPFAAARR